MGSDPIVYLTFFVQIAFFGLLLLFTIHSIFLAYHWFSFGSSRKISMTALATYLLGGAVLFLTLSLSLQMI